MKLDLILFKVAQTKQTGQEQQKKRVWDSH